MSEIFLYYFSGTGNSLHIAQELKQRIPNITLIPFISLKQQKLRDHKGVILGCVFPVYLGMIPAFLRLLIASLSFQDASYVFFIVTHGGYANPALLKTALDNILKQKQAHLDAFFALQMIGNTPTGLMPTWMKIPKDWDEHITIEKINQREQEILLELDTIVETITQRKPHRIPSTLGTRIKEPLLRRLTQSTIKTIPYLVDDTCTACGRCANICLSGKIKMEKQKPIWQPDVPCLYCYACFNYCPTQSILVKHYQLKTGRYHHPAISADLIMQQKKKHDRETQ